MTSTATRRRKPLTIDATYHGRRMPLALFDRVETTEGHAYELNKGVIEVSEVPSRTHAMIVQDVRLQFSLYQSKHPKIVRYQAGGSDAKMTINAFESERHADWSVYLTPAPEVAQPWSIWIPSLVVEVVSESSIKRDYVEKPPEYLAVGVSQYWILDPIREGMLVKTNRGGLWSDKTYKPSQKVTTLLLPGFAFDLKRALNAAK